MSSSAPQAPHRSIGAGLRSPHRLQTRRSETSAVFPPAFFAAADDGATHGRRIPHRSQKSPDPWTFLQYRQVTTEGATAGGP